MRRESLPPPRPICRDAAQAAARPLPERVRLANELPLSRGALSGPSPAVERRRPLFHPKRGWFRRLERNASHLLSRRVFPLIPGISWPYDRILKNQLGLSQAEIGLRSLPPSFEGLRLLLISDIHAGPFVSPPVLQEALERLVALKPDLIVLPGDLTTSHVAEWDRFRQAFGVLRAPLGVWAVLGNHDHYTEEADRLRRHVEQDGIQVLHNRSTRLARGGSWLSLAGVDDLILGEPDLEAALAGTRPPVILLSHNPDLLFQAQQLDVDLMLSGHTHAGQVRIPGLPVLVRQSRYRLDEGRYRSGTTELVVSRGLGAVGVPWRAACPPEAILLTLTRAPE